MSKKVILFIFIISLSSESAHAYLDPGTGSLILQGLMAVLFGGFFVLKTFGRNIKYFLTTKLKKDSKK